MNKTNLVIFAVFIAVGFMAYSYRETILHSVNGLSDVTQPVITTLQSAVSRIQTAWSTIPSTIQGIILLGIPTAFATFFAWTKTRAMQKLQQTQLEAQTTVNELQGQVTETAASKLNLESDFKAAQNQLSALTDKEQVWMREKQSLEQRLSDAQKEAMRVEAEANALAHVDQEKIAEIVRQKLRDEGRVP